jgi:hypothetical protein
MANQTTHVSSAPILSPSQAVYGTPNTNEPWHFGMHDTYLQPVNALPSNSWATCYLQFTTNTCFTGSSYHEAWRQYNKKNITPVYGMSQANCYWFVKFMKFSHFHRIKCGRLTEEGTKTVLNHVPQHTCKMLQFIRVQVNKWITSIEANVTFYYGFWQTWQCKYSVITTTKPSSAKILIPDCNPMITQC